MSSGQSGAVAKTVANQALPGAATPVKPLGRPTTGLWLWLNALALAVGAQWLIAGGRAGFGRVLLLLALALGAAALLTADRAQSPPARGSDAPPVTCPRPTSRRRGALGLGLVGLAAVAGSVWLTVTDQRPAIALWLWLAALIVLVLATAHDPSPAAPAEQASRRTRLDQALVLAGLLALTLALRLPDLETIPREVHGDEAAIGLEARRLLTGAAPTIFAVGWYDVPMISFAIPAAVMAVAADNLFGLRLASVLQGAASVIVLYLLARRLFGDRVAELAAVLLAVAQWHVHFSRGGFHYMQAVLGGLLLLYFLVRALDSGRALDFLLTGYAAGLCLTVYYAARLAPVLGALYLVARFAREPGLARRHLAGLGALALGGLVFLAPTATAILENPRAFVSRTQGVWIFTPANLRHELGAYKVDSVEEVLAIQARRTLEAFHLSGESSLQYSHPAPLVDFWTGALLAAGAGGVTLLAWRRSSYLLVAGWLWLTLLIGAILTIDAPFSPRIVGVLPALALVAALFLEAGWREADHSFGRPGQWAVGLLTTGLLGLTLIANYRDYFQTHIQVHQPAGFFTVLSSYADRIDDRYRVYLVGRPETSLRYDTPRFLLPALDGGDLRELDLPLRQLPAEKGVAFLVESASPERSRQLQAIRRAYPTAREEEIKSVRGNSLFTSLLVEPAALAEAAPGATREPARPDVGRPNQAPVVPYLVQPVR